MDLVSIFCLLVGIACYAYSDDLLIDPQQKILASFGGYLFIFYGFIRMMTLFLLTNY